MLSDAWLGLTCLVGVVVVVLGAHTALWPTHGCYGRARSREWVRDLLQARRETTLVTSPGDQATETGGVESC